MKDQFARYLLPSSELYKQAKHRFFNTLDGNVYELLNEYFNALHNYYTEDDYKLTTVDKIALMTMNSAVLSTSDSGETLFISFPSEEEFMNDNDDLSTGDVILDISHDIHPVNRPRSNISIRHIFNLYNWLEIMHQINGSTQLQDMHSELNTVVRNIDSAMRAMAALH